MSKREPGHKEYKYLYRQMLSEDLIRRAYKKLRKGKTKRPEIQKIDQNLDAEVQAMKEMILNTKPPGVEVPNPEKAYRSRHHNPKRIFEHGKWRTICKPEIHEQWLHHIIVLVLEPIIVATAYPYSCGSFPRRGGHYGKRQIERWIRADPKGVRNFAKIDIRHFYDNVRLPVLMRELAIRIKDAWFLYIIWLCLKDFKRGLPLGFYISQWLANYLLEPLDWMITRQLGITKTVRFMDDVTMFCENKRRLHSAVKQIMIMLGRRFRLRLKHNYQVCKFWFQSKAKWVRGKRRGKPKIIGRALDFMGFLFFRNRTTIRKRTMLRATRLASRLRRRAEAGKKYFSRHVSAMLSYVGWFTCTDSYQCYSERIKPCVEIRKLKRIISRIQRRKNHHERMVQGSLLQQA